MKNEDKDVLENLQSKYEIGQRKKSDTKKYSRVTVCLSALEEFLNRSNKQLLPLLGLLLLLLLPRWCSGLHQCHGVKMLGEGRCKFPSSNRAKV